MSDGALLDAEDLSAEIRALPEAHVVFLVDLLWLDRRGNLATRRNRLLSLISGPPRLRRLGILDMALHILRALLPAC